MMSRFTEESCAEIVAGVRSGLSLEEAALDAQVAPKTLRNWLTRGRKETNTPHAAFAAAVERAREAAQTAVMDETEFRACLNAAIRRGSVQAMRLWVAIRDDGPHEPDGIDALLRRRAERRERAGAAAMDPFDELDAGRGESFIERLARDAHSNASQMGALDRLDAGIFNDEGEG